MLTDWICLTYDVQTSKKLKTTEKNSCILSLISSKFYNFAADIHLLRRELNFRSAIGISLSKRSIVIRKFYDFSILYRDIDPVCSTLPAFVQRVIVLVEAMSFVGDMMLF